MPSKLPRKPNNTNAFSEMLKKSYGAAVKQSLEQTLMRGNRAEKAIKAQKIFEEQKRQEEQAKEQQDLDTITNLLAQYQR